MYYKVVISYDGTNYYGWEKQQNVRPTIQETLENAIYQRLSVQPTILASGRTDKGVHALGQVCLIHHPNLGLAPEALMRMMNGALPEDIQVVSAEMTDENFHFRVK